MKKSYRDTVDPGGTKDISVIHSIMITKKDFSRIVETIFDG